MQQHLERLVDLATRVSSKRLAQRARELVTWSERAATHVVVCGEFKRGKSTLVNALLEVDICPTDALPQTAVPAVFEHATVASARVEYLDGRIEAIEPTRQALQGFSVDHPENAQAVRLVSVHLPSPLLATGLVLIDTPGVNDLSAQRADVTFSFLPLSDAAVVVLDATAPLTRSEAAFLKDHVVPSVLDRAIFVLGKVDRLEADDLEDALSGARQRIEQVSHRAAPVIPVSARLALQGRPENLAPLRERLMELARTTATHKERLARERAARLASELDDELSARLEADALGEDERELVRIQAEDARLRAAMVGDKLREYIDVFGRRTLLDIVGRSIEHFEKRVLEDLTHQLSLRDSHLDQYVHREVPARLRAALRGWSDAKSREIEAFLEKLVEQVSKDFATAFAVPLQSAALPPRPELPEYANAGADVEVHRVRDMIVHQILPNAVPMVAGLLLGGPIGMLLGSFAGRIAEAQHREGRTTEQKRAAEALLREAVPAAFTTFSESTQASLSSWFDRLQEIVAIEARLRLADAELRTSAEGLVARGDLMTVRSELQTLRLSLMEVPHG